MKTEVNINPSMLQWAMDYAGYDVERLISKFPKIREWLEGKKKPTVKQLEDFSKKVHVPFGYLFLQNPPQEKLPIPFFRTHKNQSDKININLYDTILALQQKQDWLKNYLRDNNFSPLPFVSKYQGSNDVKTIVNDIYQTLQLGHSWASQFKTWEEAQNHLILHIENQRIITIFNSIFENNTHRPIPFEECRGFVLIDNYAPFMFINSSDFKSAQMFTIAHELAHIWLGQSAGFDYDKLLPADDKIEKLCDKVAAEFLVPEQEFNEEWKYSSKNFSYLSRHFKVSEIVIARRALDTGKISKDEFLNFYTEYSKREFGKKESKNSGGDFHQIMKKRVSVSFARYVHQALTSEQLLYRDAYKLIGLKGNTFEKFMSNISFTKK